MPATWELVNAVGKDAAKALQEALGGQSVYIPTKPRAGHPVAHIVGFENMRQICRCWGGSTTYFGKGLVEAERNATWAAAAAAGASTTQLASRAGVTARCVRQVLQTHMTHRRQLPEDAGGRRP